MCVCVCVFVCLCVCVCVRVCVRVCLCLYNVLFVQEGFVAQEGEVEIEDVEDVEDEGLHNIQDSYVVEGEGELGDLDPDYAVEADQEQEEY